MFLRHCVRNWRVHFRSQCALDFVTHGVISCLLTSNEDLVTRVDAIKLLGKAETIRICAVLAGLDTQTVGTELKLSHCLSLLQIDEDRREHQAKG